MFQLEILCLNQNNLEYLSVVIFLINKKNKNILKVIHFFIKKYMFYFIFIFIFIIIIYSMIFNIQSSNAKNFIVKNIEYERERIQDAINEYYMKEKEYPQLKGKENYLNLIISQSNNLTFVEFYGSDKLYEIPGNQYEGNEKTNKIIEYYDGTGGWVYNNMSGKIYPNISIYKDK